MDTYTDASYTQTLNDSGSKPYIMAVSPWFFTNLPGYDKNWLWRGDDLWYDRWVEVIYNQPEFMEIISWNDYSESHYIGPLYDYTLEAFKIGKAPSNFATDIPHDGWRLLLPYVIDMYKSETAHVSKEGLVSWYRLSPAAACGGGTTGNTASQLQLEYAPTEVVQDRIFVSALLTMDATVTVSVGGVVQTATWSWKPDGGIGIYHGHVPLTGSGPVVMTLSRGGTQLAQINGKSISAGCTDGLFNAWVGSASASGAVSASPALSVSKMACINGTGTGNFAGLCDFACSYGYCPISACTCRQIGRPLKAPNSTGIIGYPIAGEDASYSGLCAFNCNLGYCPESSCGTEEVPLIVPTVSDFSPPACIAGSGSRALAGLCSFSCNYGFCPRNVCTCTGQGALVPSPDVVSITGSPVDGLDDAGLCNFACNHGYCPEGTCTGSGSATSGEVYAPPEIWKSSKPDVECIPPCRIILPPYPLKDDTTITFNSMVTSVWTKSGTSTETKTTILSVPSLVTNEIPFWPVVIPSGMTTPAAFYPLQSVMPPSRPMVLNSNEAPFSPVPSGSATPKPIFAEGTQTVTIQPQATVSVSVGSNIPSVTWSNATPSKTCTTGCGTDSCELFGGCDSSNPADDCGTQGCGGGCNIQGCSQSCGLTCSTDQHHVDTDSDSSSSSNGSSGGSSGTAQRPTLPFDYDGSDGSTNGDWNPPPMDAELATNITSAIEAQITAIKPIYSSIYGMIEQGVATPSVPNNVKTSAQSQATSVKKSVATYVSKVQDRMRDRTPNSDISAGLNWFSKTLKSIEYTLDVAANAIDTHDFVSLRAGIGATEEINIEAGADIYNDDWPRDIDSVHLNKRAVPPSCAPFYQGDPRDPSNADAIPKELGCNSKSGYKI
ncbi:unnamed protein product [Penicillium salamii]|uniref:Uncharacterized protein n=1 Tax=Penicillium salamii TaxID=1612424 RepID=A0A9W4NWK1_9EURO|nr:unnamed protein product [Penicillium salamii]